LRRLRAENKAQIYFPFSILHLSFVIACLGGCWQ
jgi:hypothetical protein